MIVRSSIKSRGSVAPLKARMRAQERRGLLAAERAALAAAKEAAGDVVTFRRVGVHEIPGGYAAGIEAVEPFAHIFDQGSLGNFTKNPRQRKRPYQMTVVDRKTGRRRKSGIKPRRWARAAGVAGKRQLVRSIR